MDCGVPYPKEGFQNGSLHLGVYPGDLEAETVPGLYPDPAESEGWVLLEQPGDDLLEGLDLDITSSLAFQIPTTLCYYLDL